MGAERDTRSSAEDTPRDPVRSILLIALLLLALLAFRPLADYDPDAGVRGAVQGVEGWFFSPTGRSPVFIFAVSLMMFFGRRHRLLAAIAAGRSEPLLATLFLLPAAGLFGWATYVGGPDLLVPALIPTILGTAALLGGRGALLSILLPALFLFLAVPPPAVLINQVVYPLQLMTAASTTAILHAVGVEAFLAGDQVATRHGVFQVIESCTGLRTAETLVMAAILYGETWQRRWWWIGLLVLAVPIISLVANQARVLSIVFNPYSQVSEVHTLQGIIVLVGGVLAIAGVDALLARLLGAGHRRDSVRRQSLQVLPVRPLAAATAFVALLGFASFAIQPWQPPPRASRTLADFPSVLRGWKSEAVTVDTQYLGTVRFTERMYRRYKSPDGTRVLDVFIGIDEHLQRNFSLLSGKTRVLAAGDSISASEPVPIPPDDTAGELLRSRSGWLALHWRRNVEPLRVEAMRSLLALDRSGFRRPVRSTVVRIATPLGHGLDEAAAREFLLEVTPDVRAMIDALESNALTPELYKRITAPREMPVAG